MVNQPHLFKDLNKNILKKSDNNNTLKFAPDEYKLWYITGLFGKGKTVFLTWLVKKYEQNYSMITANYNIDTPNFQRINRLTGNVILNLNPDRTNKMLLVIHEAFKDMDKRQSMHNKRQELFNAIFQIRKKNIDIIMDIPDLHYPDLKGIKSANGFYTSHGKIINTDIFVYTEHHRIERHGIFDFPVKKTFTINMGNVYQYYDTFELSRDNQRQLNSGIF